MNDPYAGISKEYHPLVDRYGRDLFLLVWWSQLAGIACEKLTAQAEKRQSKDIAYANAMLGEGFNTLAQLLIERASFTQEQLIEVDREIQLTFRESLARVQAEPIILQ